MNVPQKVFDSVTRHGSDGQIIGVDLATVVQRLLLFDTVIIKSSRLVEIPEFIRAFGKAGFLTLLNSGVLKCSYELAQIVGDPVRNGVREQPLDHFTFGTVDFANRESDLEALLRPLQGVPGLKNEERRVLEQTVLQELLRPAPNYRQQLLAQFESDLRSSTPALGAAVRNQLMTQFGHERPFNLIVEENAERVFHLRSDLADAFGISAQTTHDILSRSVFAVARLDQRLADMAAYSAISGFAESEAPLLFGRFAGILAPLNSKSLEEQFKRVIRVGDLPNVLPHNKIDVEALLKARDSVECREFRAWLSNLGPLSDLEIREMVGGIRNKAGSVLLSNPAKWARFAATAVIGLINPIAGVAAGAADSFGLDRILQTSNVFAFLTKTYPSLFESP